VTTPTAPISIVTGASRGIGLAIAHALGRMGHRLVLVARDRPRLDAAVQAMHANGISAIAVAADLRDPAASDWWSVLRGRALVSPPS
jgi:short-subunit dehydrogenase